MVEVPEPAVKAYHESSGYLVSLLKWSSAQLYAWAGLFYGAVISVLIEGKGLLLTEKKKIETDPKVQEIKSDLKKKAESVQNGAVNGYAKAVGEHPKHTQQRAQHAVNDLRSEAAHTARR